MLRRTYTPDGLSAIYGNHVNLAEWCREVSPSVQLYAANMSQQLPGYSMRLVVPGNIKADALLPHLPRLSDIGETDRLDFASDIGLLCDMYASLFDITEVGLRLSVLNRAMCPRFHVDQVVCRMICTYHGAGTEWLPDTSVDRDKLGPVSSHPGEQNAADVQQLSEGSVALLKGEQWPGNTGRGVVHRSPAASPGQSRLVATLDPVA